MSHLLKWASRDSDAFYNQILSLLNLKLNRSHIADEPFLIAIDGNCGSGESTLALFLQSHYDRNLFHMDDFYLPWALKTPERLNIIEGSYSMHPKLIEAYDFKIFLSISEVDQAARILARNGEEGLKRFQELWIPLENRYFEACAILECADLVVGVDSI